MPFFATNALIKISIYVRFLAAGQRQAVQFALDPSGDLPRELPPLSVEAHNSILMTTSSSGIVAMSGNTSEADFRKLFVWSGQKNFYDGFEDWKTIGDVGASNDKLFWLTERSDVAAMSLEALTLDRNSSISNPALNAATDGNNAGADTSKLPRLAEAAPANE